MKKGDEQIDKGWIKSSITAGYRKDVKKTHKRIMRRIAKIFANY